MLSAESCYILQQIHKAVVKLSGIYLEMCRHPWTSCSTRMRNPVAMLWTFVYFEAEGTASGSVGIAALKRVSAFYLQKEISFIWRTFILSQIKVLIGSILYLKLSLVFGWISNYNGPQNPC